MERLCWLDGLHGLEKTTRVVDHFSAQPSVNPADGLRLGHFPTGEWMEIVSRKLGVGENPKGIGIMF